MNDRDFNWRFAIVATFNTSLGLTNINKNTEQETRQIRIEQKLDKISEMLNNECK